MSKRHFFSDLTDCQLCHCGCWYYGPASKKQCDGCDFDDQNDRVQRARATYYRSARARQSQRG